jgi:hypothetical protein
VGITVPSDADRADFAAVRRAVARINPTLAVFSIETPLVGTRLYDETASMLTSRDSSLYDLNHALLPTRLPLDEFYREYTRLQIWSMARAGMGPVRIQRPGDLIRNLLTMPGALWSMRNAAADHGSAHPVSVPA